jgi:protein SCO1/2
MIRLCVWAAVLAVALAACAPEVKGTSPAHGGADCTHGPLDQIGGPINLTRQDGARVTQAVFSGKPAIVYFGFASCPDFCPTALQKLDAVLAERADGLQPIFITIDPERDTPAFLARYSQSEAFPANLTALTGSQADIDAAAAAFKVFHAKAVDESSALGYTMDHSRFVYVLDGSWRTVTMFRDELTPKAMNACINAALSAKRVFD